MFWGKLMLRELVAAPPDLAAHVSIRRLIFGALLGAIFSMSMAFCSLMPASIAYTTRGISRLVAISVHGKPFHA